MLVNLLLQDGMSFSNELRIDGSTLGRTNYMEGLMRTSAYMPMHELIGFSHVALLCYCSKLCSILMPFLSLQPMCICKLLCATFASVPGSYKPSRAWSKLCHA